MFIKERVRPVQLDLLPSLLNRLPSSHPGYEKVQHHLRSINAGFGGEQYVDERLRHMNWDVPHFIVGDLNVASGRTFCQIDTLVFTPHYVLVLEVKNFSGTLQFQGNRYQMTRITREGDEEGFDSPVSQVLRAVNETEILLRKAGLSLPIFRAVVLPYARTIVKGTPDHVPIVFSKALPLFISNLPTTNPLVATEDLQFAAEKIASFHQPFIPKNFSSRYEFTLSDLRTGVICSDCGRSAAKQSIRAHYCHACQMPILDGYVSALRDWRDFISPLIRSSECQTFLQLPNKNATYYVLKNLAERIEYGLWRIKEL